MYQTPKLIRFGRMSELTRAGCSNASDGLSVPGVGTAIGDEPEVTNGTTKICFVGVS
ncbi:MAG TPA: hypothetical protein VFU06_09255 [Longimicrobiales bacterium]|nr:hypothetical protein [Longimicrobiales bacterium]